MDCGRGIILGLAVAAALAAAACGVRGPAKESMDNDEEAPIAAVQALLRRDRLYAGPVDGLPGMATTAAVRRYQILHGMRATGQMDPVTLHAMLAPPPPLAEALTDADRETLRELAEAALPEPVVAERRLPIPASPPPPSAAPSASPRTKANSARSAKHRHGVSGRAPSE